MCTSLVLIQRAQSQGTDMTGAMVAWRDRSVLDSGGTDKADFAVVSVLRGGYSSLVCFSLAIGCLRTPIRWSSGFIGIAILSAAPTTSAPGPLSRFGSITLTFLHLRLSGLRASSTTSSTTAVLVRAGGEGRLRVGHLVGGDDDKEVKVQRQAKQ